MSTAFQLECGPSFPVELILSFLSGQRYAELNFNGLPIESLSLCRATRVSLLNLFLPQQEHDNSLLLKLADDIPIKFYILKKSLV